MSLLLHSQCTAAGSRQAQTKTGDEPRALDEAVAVDSPVRLLILLRVRGYHGVFERAQSRRQIRCQVNGSSGGKIDSDEDRLQLSSRGALLCLWPMLAG